MFQSHEKRFNAQQLNKHQRRRRPRVEQLEDRRLLATFTVQTELDVIDLDDGVASLREAVAIANVSPGPDEIVFDFGHDGPATIRLSLGELLVAEALTITGPGADLLTIVPQGRGQQAQSRIFNFIAEEGDFAISGMTLRGGRALGSGGAIRSATSGLLSINHSVITGSTVQGTTGPDAEGHGGGIFTAGDVRLTDSVISNNSARGNGGGIRAGGAVTAISSTVAGNSSTGNKYEGGGISAQGSVTITGSTITGNSVNGDGGGVFAGGVLRITNSTVSGNSASSLPGTSPLSAPGGGGVWGGGRVTIESSTITGNSAASAGGVFSEKELTIRNSIVAENLGVDVVSGGDTIDVRYSLIGDNATTNLVEAPVGMPDANGNLIGGPVSGEIDPILGPLQDNGGPTHTHALLPGSPAIEAGDPAAVAGQRDVPQSDQRGAARVAEGNGDGVARIDMGAYELLTPYEIDVPGTIVVDSLVDELDGDFSVGNLSLREAVVLANFAEGPNEILFDHELFDTLQSLELSFGDFSMTDALTITGPGANLLAIDANRQSRIFNIVAAEGDFAISGMTLRDGLDNDGGAIRSLSSGVLSIDHSVITGNRAERFITFGEQSGTRGLEGGGVFAMGPVMLNDSTIAGNSAKYGGGIYSTDRVTVTGSTISGNSAAAHGGGVWTGGDLLVINSTISENSAPGVEGSDQPDGTGTGGGIWGGANVTIESSTIAGNSAEVAAGVHSDALLAVRNSIVADNSGEGEIASVAEMYNVQFSLIGDNEGTNLVEAPSGMPDAKGSLIGGPVHGAIDPLLGPLQDNGGPTHTRAPLHGSPVIDAGDPSAVAGQNGVPEFDQRGAPFSRVDVLGSQVIDMGTVEVLLSPPLPGDYNLDGIVNTIDYVVYRDRVGQLVTPYTTADGNGNGVIDRPDYQVWRANFGKSSPPSENAADAGVANAAFTSQIESPRVAEVKRRPIAAKASSGSSASADLFLLTLLVRQENSDSHAADFRDSHGLQHTTAESDAVFAEIGWRGVRRLAFDQRVR